MMVITIVSKYIPYVTTKWAHCINSNTTAILLMHLLKKTIALQPFATDFENLNNLYHEITTKIKLIQLIIIFEL